MITEKLIAQLQRHAGYRQYPYLCASNYLSVGYGRNLQTVGVPKFEALAMLRNDASTALHELVHRFPYVTELETVRLEVLVHMVVRMGIARFSGFQRLMHAIRHADYNRAADEMKNSRWFEQVGLRALELTHQMRYGIYQVH